MQNHFNNEAITLDSLVSSFVYLDENYEAKILTSCNWDILQIKLKHFTFMFKIILVQYEFTPNQRKKGQQKLEIMLLK